MRSAEHSSSARDAKSRAAPATYFVDSHLVAFTFKAGWLTKRCQTTAHSPSVWGVIRSGETVGMMTQASEASLVAPPSLPTMPNTGAFTCCAITSALTRLGD